MINGKMYARLASVEDIVALECSLVSKIESIRDDMLINFDVGVENGEDAA